MTKKVKFIRRSNVAIKIEVTIDNNGLLSEIINPTDYRFPYPIGRPYNKDLEDWAKVNSMRMFINDEEVIRTKKIFGIPTNQVPRDHALRHIYPNKFR